MQFQYNSDYPGLTAAGTVPAPAASPPSFPPAQPFPCARITTRVFHPKSNQVSTVQNVLVRTAPSPILHRVPKINQDDSFSSDMSSDSSSFSGSDSDSMKLDDSNSPLSPPQRNLTTQPRQHDNPGVSPQNAYWIQRTIRDAIYGRVLFAVVLRRRHNPTDGADWEVTTDHCAVKELSWQHIKKESGKLAEDPIKEVSAMQYLRKWFQTKHGRIQPLTANSSVSESFRAMRESNIMMPLDLLSDERNLYSIMPYCDGGELFERLDLNERFSEDEARYWIDQVLNVSFLEIRSICTFLKESHSGPFFLLLGHRKYATRRNLPSRHESGKLIGT